MKWAVVDIGSNSMRLSAYDVEKTSFKTLFKEKTMAGLAGYVEDGRLSEEGIARACDGLLDFKETLDTLELDHVSVFATASLRNVCNTDQAVRRLREATGLPVEVLSGEEEALYGYVGAMCDLNMQDGVFVDIGGASTEIVRFADGALQDSSSYAVGSLKLYRDCVKKLLPGKGAMDRMGETLRREFPSNAFQIQEKPRSIACVGGSARAVLKLARRQFGLSAGERRVSAEQMETLFDLLAKGDREAIDLILKTDPERVHTLIPGLMILRYVVKNFGAKEIVVSQYGIREGYLCQRVQCAM